MITIIVVLGVATVLNPLVPVSILKFLNEKLRYLNLNVGYYGLYPGDQSAESFLLAIFPQSIGIPLLILSAIGIAILLFSRGHKKINVYFLIFLFLPFFVQIMTWNSTFRASRFAFTFFYLLFLISGIFLSSLVHHRRLPFKLLGTVLFVSTIFHTFFFSVAYTQTRTYPSDGRVKTAQWIRRNLDQNTTLGVRSAVDLPRNLGPIDHLAGYKYVLYEDLPDYCIIDGFEYLVLDRYFERVRNNYTYSDTDWWPSRRGPDQNDIKTYDDIINGKRYKLIRVISSTYPRFLGLKFNMSLLFDPAEYYHRYFYIFRRLDI